MENYITEVDILDEAKECFLVYSAEVLTDRAVPAAEDGLLSSQRKILWTMEDYLKMSNQSKTKKCNAVVGSTLATSYYHGDASCYGVLCKMSQKYLMRYPLIHGQGSLGTQEDNDLVSSSRYTEAKPSIYADLMMLDYKKNPVPVKETYNGEFMEPVVLPSLFPNALCNGRQAIGISMAHSSVPHNLTEVCNAILAYIDNPKLTIDDIMQYIKGPDFPLGNVVINKKDIRAAFASGKSSVSLKVRGDYTIEGNKIIFTSIPYRTYRNKIKEQLEKNVDEFEKYLDDFNDESNIGENRLVFFAKPGQVDKLLTQLFKFTDLQSTVSYNMNYIVNGTPKLCSIKDLIIAYVTHQHNVLINVATTDLEKAKGKEHILEGLVIAIKDIDNAIQIIKNSNNKEEARKSLIAHFGITETQANAVLDMKLAKLTKLDKDELLKELEELRLAIIKFEKIINDYNFRNQELKEKVIWLRDNYGDARRTQLLQLDEPKEEKEEVYIEPEKVVVVMTEAGNIKRIPAKSLKAQSRNTKGIRNQDDIVNSVIRTNTIDQLMIFTNKGKMYKLLVDKVPAGTNVSRGTPVRSLVTMAADERPVAIYSIYHDTAAKYLLTVSKNGRIKKTLLTEYEGVQKKSGVAALKIREGDSLVAVTLINEEEVMLCTYGGKVIRIKTSDIAPTGRTRSGIKGITLAEEDYVVSCNPIRNKDDYFAVFTENGMGKKVMLTEFSCQNKGGKGVICSKVPVAASAMVDDTDHVLVMGNNSSVCVAAVDIPLLSRVSLGNIMIKDNKVIQVSKT